MKRSLLELDEISSIAKKLKTSMTVESNNNSNNNYTSPLKKKRNNLDSIDFTSLKRNRVFDPEQVSDLDPILLRICGWLREQNERQSLPKTFTKLVRSISSMCRIKVQIDPTVVFYHLLFNNVIIIEPAVGGGVTYRANPDRMDRQFIGIVPDDGGVVVDKNDDEKEDVDMSNRAPSPSPSPPAAHPAQAQNIPFSDDFVKALKRTTNWILANRGLHNFKGQDGLLKGMTQLCAFRKELSPLQVVEGLKRKGYIYSGESQDEVCYSLPTSSHALPRVHYPPVYTRVADPAAFE